MNKPKKTTFEQKLIRLEEISALLESDDIGLEEAINLYEEGIELSKICMDTLRNAELKITELKKQVEQNSTDDK